VIGNSRLRPTWGLFVALGLALLWFCFVPERVDASVPAPDSACKLCHVGNAKELVLPSGETLSLGVGLEELQQSVHGMHATEQVYCVDCHAGRRRYRFPHEPNPAQNLQEFRADIAQNCEQCHVSGAVHNPGHLQVEDKTGIPTCADCHGGHTVTSSTAMAADPVGTCQSCHQTFEDPHVGDVHAEVVMNLGSDQSCETCHSALPQAEDTQCKACHSLLTSQLTLISGQKVDLHVNPDVIAGSVHGERQVQGQLYQALQCTDCHRDQGRYGFPHPELTAETARELTIDMENLCQECHQEIFQRQADGIHGIALEEGEVNSATCADCHGNHDIQDPDEPRARVSHTCAGCHSTIQAQYTSSVHGAALEGEDNPDVPVCTDCHGVHDIGDPTTAEFRLKSPQLCGNCHANEQMMAKYGISTDVFDTYVADFHGTTVRLFEKQAPDQQTNKAVCYDCHGVHNILPANDAHSQVIKENLLVTCQQCHPDANANFPASWTSHFKPSMEHNPVVYLVNLFYQILIPVLVGGFALYVGTDVLRRWWDRIRRRKSSLP
jgi:hypothetical protein